MKPLRHPIRSRQAGTALLLVAVLGTLAMALWAASYRATHDTFSVERFYQQRLNREELSMAALIRAGNLLRTGLPPTGKYICIAAQDTATGKRHAKVVFKRHGGKATWLVEASEATASDRARYPEMPDRFSEKMGKGQGKGKGNGKGKGKGKG